MKRPAYAWYPGDWWRDTALQSCSWEARALWRDLLDLMHDGDPYGHLAVKGKGIPIATVAKMIRLALPRLRRYLGELEAAGVSSRTSDGILFSRRMVRDEDVRTRRAAGGAKSLDNPNVPRPKEGPPEGYPSAAPKGVLGGGDAVPSPAVAVAVAVAKDYNDDGPRARYRQQADAFAAEMEPSGASALFGYLRGSHDPDRLLAEFASHISGLHGPGGRAVTPLQLGTALHEMALANVTMTAKKLAAFVRRVLEPDPPARGKAAEPENEWTAAARKIDAEEAARKATHV